MSTKAGPAPAHTKAALVSHIHGLGSEHSRSRLTRMRKDELEQMAHRLDEWLGDERVLTPDEFIKRTHAGTLPTYRGAGYWPAWLAPNGQLIVGDCHNSITGRVKSAHDADKYACGSYAFMAKRGFIRLVPDRYWHSLSLETNKTVPTTDAQLATLRRLADEVDWRGNWSYINNKKVTSAAELMAAVNGDSLPAAAA